MRRPQPPKWLLVVLLVFAVGAAGAAAVGLTSVTNNDDGVVLNQPGGPTANLTGNFDAYSVSGGGSTIQWNTSAGNASFSSSGETNARIVASEITGQWTNISNVEASGADLTINPEDKASATVGGSVNALSFQQASGVGVGDGQRDFVYSASGSGTVTLRNLPSSTTFHAVTASGDSLGEVSTDSSGAGTVLIQSGSNVQVYLVNADAPVIESASPEDGGKTNQSSVTLSATISDQDFADTTGDTVTATFYLDGSVVDTKTTSVNGTFSTEVQPTLGENHTWHVELEDKYGKIDSIAARDINVPAELRVFYETQPEKLVKGENISLTVRFFPEGGGDIRTVEVQDGVADFTGLPVEGGFVVTVKANASENFTYRRIVVDSLYETQRIFLLRENKSHSRTVFELQDPTGQFPPEDTVLFVEKPITINNSTSYYTIAGDTFGATGRFPVVLQSDARYRLRVVSNNSERILGAYNAYGNSLETLKIQRIEPKAGDKETGVVYGSLTQSANNSTLAVRFLGGDPGTVVTYTVTDGDGNVVVPETTTEATKFAHIYEFNRTGTQTYNVSYQIERPDGSTTSHYFIAGELGGIADRFDIDPQVLSIVSWIGILATMGLVVIIDKTLAPAAGTGMAAALSIMGTVAIPMPLLGVAGAVSVLTLFGGRR